jgi:hypothetical protein
LNRKVRKLLFYMKRWMLGCVLKWRLSVLLSECG